MTARPEWNFQRTAYVFLRRALPPGSEIQSNDSAGRQSAVARMRDSARGIKSGWPDMVCVVEGFPDIYIELKAGRGTTSDKQDARGAALLRLGRHYFVAWTLEDIEAGLRRIGVPLSASTGALLDLAAAPNPPRKARASKPRAEKPSARAVAAAERFRRRMFGG